MPPWYLDENRDASVRRRDRDHVDISLSVHKNARTQSVKNPEEQGGE